jgi:hypothetical protein
MALQCPLGAALRAEERVQPSVKTLPIVKRFYIFSIFLVVEGVNLLIVSWQGKAEDPQEAHACARGGRDEGG